MSTQQAKGSRRGRYRCVPLLDLAAGIPVSIGGCRLVTLRRAITCGSVVSACTLAKGTAAATTLGRRRYRCCAANRPLAPVSASPPSGCCALLCSGQCPSLDSSSPALSSADSMPQASGSTSFGGAEWGWRPAVGALAAPVTGATGVQSAPVFCHMFVREDAVAAVARGSRQSSKIS